MAEGENITMCPVCSEDYQVKGDHVPRILPCFHTVCEGCISGKLCKGTYLECPECGIEHTAQNGIKNIQENKYIISYIKKMAEKQPAENLEKADVRWKMECSKHGKEQNLFCNESGCQMPICITCLKDDHKAHDFSDLHEAAEERCTTVLHDVRSMKKMLQEKKGDLLAAQKIGAQNCQECTLEIIHVKADLIREIDKRATDLVYEIKQQKENTDASINEAIAEIDEDLVKLSTLERGTNRETVFQIQTEKLEKLKDAKNKIQSRFPEATRFTSLTYKTCVSKSKLKHLSMICGKLIKKNKRIQSKKVKARAKYAIPAEETDPTGNILPKENKAPEPEVVSVSGDSLMRKKRKKKSVQSVSNDVNV